MSHTYPIPACRQTGHDNLITMVFRDKIILSAIDTLPFRIRPSAETSHLVLFSHISERTLKRWVAHSGTSPFEGAGQETLKLDGTKVYDITDIEKDLYPQKKLSVSARRKDGNITRFTVTARIDSQAELTYFIHGGILPYVLRNLK